MAEESFEGKYYIKYFYDKKLLFLIFSALDLNIYMYVGAHVSRFKVFQYKFLYSKYFSWFQLIAYFEEPMLH